MRGDAASSGKAGILGTAAIIAAFALLFLAGIFASNIFSARTTTTTISSIQTSHSTSVVSSSTTSTQSETSQTTTTTGSASHSSTLTSSSSLFSSSTSSSSLSSSTSSTSSSSSSRTTTSSQSSSTTRTSSTSTTSSTTSSSTTTTTTTSSTSTQPGTVEVVLPVGVGDNNSLNFAPSKIKVVVGVNNTIIWNDLDYVQHTVESVNIPAGAKAWKSGIMNQGQTFTVTLTVPGNYRYVCSIHPDWMIGTIQVVA